MDFFKISNFSYHFLWDFRQNLLQKGCSITSPFSKKFFRWLTPVKIPSFDEIFLWTPLAGIFYDPSWADELTHNSYVCGDVAVFLTDNNLIFLDLIKMIVKKIIKIGSWWMKKWYFSLSQDGL